MMDIHRDFDGHPYENWWMSTEVLIDVHRVLLDIWMKADGSPEKYR